MYNIDRGDNMSLKDELDKDKPLRMSPLSLLFAQSDFRMKFFEKNPQCKGCKRVDVITMDYGIYRRIIVPEYCSKCPKFKENEKD